jgi:hypothetical protein
VTMGLQSMNFSLPFMGSDWTVQTDRMGDIDGSTHGPSTSMVRSPSGFRSVYRQLNIAPDDVLAGANADLKLMGQTIGGWLAIRRAQHAQRSNLNSRKGPLGKVSSSLLSTWLVERDHPGRPTRRSCRHAL